MAAGGVSSTGHAAAVAQAFKTLSRIFCNRRLPLMQPPAPAAVAHEPWREKEVGQVEAAVVAALLRGVVDSHAVVAQAAVEAFERCCIVGSREAVEAVLRGLGAGEDTSREGGMYRGQIWLTGRSLQAASRASYVNTGALTVLESVGTAGIGPGEPEVEGQVSEAWLQQWCASRGVGDGDAARVGRLVRGGAALVSGHVERHGEGQRQGGEADVLAALSKALPIKFSGGNSSGSCSVSYGRFRALPWKVCRNSLLDAERARERHKRGTHSDPPFSNGRQLGTLGAVYTGAQGGGYTAAAVVRREPRHIAEAEPGGWEEAGRVRELVDGLGVLGPLGGTARSMELVLKAAASSDGGVRRSALSSLSVILAHLHLCMPESNAVPGNSPCKYSLSHSEAACPHL